MLRHSLTVLILLFLLGLVMILSYAAWNREAAPEALAQAQEYLDTDRTRNALRLLNHTERTIGPNGDPELRRELYELRYEAHELLGNQKAALRDLGLLQRAFGEPSAEKSREYRLAKIRLLLALGSKEPDNWKRALDQARADLSEGRGDHELRELTGQILQAIYRADLGELVNEDLPLILPKDELQRAKDAIESFVYRERSDPEGARQRKILQGVLSRHVLDTRRLENTITRVDAIRDRVLETSEHYRFALRGRRSAYAALQGYCGQLLRSDRAEEAASLAWLYLLRFPRRFGSYIAASRALEAFVAIGNIPQACAAGAYWLEKNPIARVVEQRWLNERYLDAYQLYARALHRNKDDNSLQALTDELMKHNKKYNALFWPDMHWKFGLLYSLQKDTDGVERALSEYCRAYDWRRATKGSTDFYREAIKLRYEAALSRGNDARIDQVLEEWLKARPADLDPRITRSKRLLERGEFLLCVADCNTIIESDDAGTDERESALALRLEARNRQLAPEGRDARSVLQQLVQDDGASIVIPDPVIHVGVAQLALDAKLLKIARRSIRAAAETLQWSTTVRLLQARAAMMRGEDAIYDIEQVLTAQPNSLAGRTLMVDALEKGEASDARIKRAWYELIRTNPNQLRSMLQFGKLLIDRGEYALALELGNADTVDEQSKRELAWIRGRALLGLNRAKDAIQALTTLPPGSEHRQPALALAISTAARIGSNDQLPKLRRMLLKSQASADTLRNAAEVLASHRQYREALEILLEISERNPSLIDGRDGRLFVLIGRLLHAMGQVDAAQENWEAAYSFKDGTEAIPLLSLSLVFEGKIDEAKEVLQLTPQPQGDAVLLAYLYFRLGDSEKAANALRSFEMNGRSRLLPKLLRQALHLAAKRDGPVPDRTPYPWFDQILEAKPELSLEAIALSNGIAFESRADEAMRNLVSFHDGADKLVKASLATLTAYQDLLANRDRDAAGRLANVVADHPEYFPAYDEMFLLVEDERPDLLMTVDMVARYTVIYQNLPPDLVAKSRIPIHALNALAEASAKQGKKKDSKKFYEIAHMLSRDDASPLRALARAAEESGDLATALERQFQVIDRVTGRARTEELRFAFALALTALETTDGKSAETGLGRLVRRAADLAQSYRDRVSRREADPLGHAVVLQIKLDEIAQTDTEEGRRESAIQLLNAMMRPIIEGRVPAHRDLEGLLLALEELGAREAPEKLRKTLTSILIRDPSLLDVWLFRSRIEEQYQNVQGALDAIDWIARILPNYRPAIEQLVRLRGRNPVADPGIYETLLKRVPDENSALWAKGVIEARLGNALIAESHFANATDKLLDPEAMLRDYNKIYAAGPTGEMDDVQVSMLARSKRGMVGLSNSAEDVAIQLDLLVEDRAREAEATAVERERALLRSSESAQESELNNRRAEKRLKRQATIDEKRTK